MRNSFRLADLKVNASASFFAERTRRPNKKGSIMNNQISAALLIAIGSLGISSASFAQDGLYVSGGLNNTTIEQGLTRNTGSNGPTTGPATGQSISEPTQPSSIDGGGGDSNGGGDGSGGGDDDDG